VEFLEQRLARFDTPIILIEDNAPYHRSGEVNQVNADHAQRLSVEPLPVCSPEYNPIEKLWRNTKKEATHLKYFETFKELHASVLELFRAYLDDATQVIRVMKKLRTNAGVARASIRSFREMIYLKNYSGQSIPACDVRATV
jgi:hypothetical protein